MELGRLVIWNWDFQAQSGLTGELHRPDRCRGFQWKLPSPAWVTRCVSGRCRVFRRRGQEDPTWTGLTGAGDRSDWCGL
jgi:hypothetical protein